MVLNIKDPETHALAARLAKLAGESVTEAITTALRERLARLEADALAEELLTIGHDCARRLKEPWRTIDHADLLYGRDGLPRRDPPPSIPPLRR